MTEYAELHVHSSYSFLDGASSPADLVQRAAELELTAIGITDHDGLPGVVQLAEAAREHGIATVIGSEITVPNSTISVVEKRMGATDPQGSHVVVLARHAQGYAGLSRVLAEGMLSTGEKGCSNITLETLAEHSLNQWQILTGCRKGHLRQALEQESGVWGLTSARTELDRLVHMFGRDNLAVEITNTGQPLDRERNAILAQLAAEQKLRLVATGNVHMARASDRPVFDVLAATRAGKSLTDLEPWMPPWPACLHSAQEMLELHPDHPHAVIEAARLGEELSFDLSLVTPRLPPFPVPDGYNEASWLRELTYRGAKKRYGDDSQAIKQIEHELQVITQLGFPGYFLIVHEIVEFCRQQGIWCQGRGSAANSAVCFALGITAVDAVRHQMLFERFLSPGRSGPPDIDIDIEARRREEVIQHVYERYGRHCAAQVANVITYRPRSAIRDVARALGHDPGKADGWAKSLEYRPGNRGKTAKPEGARRWGLSDQVPTQVQELASRLQRLPRHLGIHSGGMVLCDRPVIDVCPVGWGSMPGRTVLQWDKEDCAEAGLVKFDLLGLGMLTALRLGFSDITRRGVRNSEGQILDLHNIAQDDPRVFDLLCAADTVGVFQVESRAQMSTLPRMQPRTFYDIVIEVALIRPGPIQGNSVNPYLARRRGREAVTYPHPLLENALQKTLGVPLFQEQLMQIAIDAAGFSPAQADRLRKAMGAKRSYDRMEQLKAELLDGMRAKGIDSDTAHKIFDKLQAFAEFGFPESHSFSFAYLVYASAWLKVHFPENFYAGILGAQPMGFYSPQTLVADARRHGVLILPVDVCYSLRHSAVEDTPERHIIDPHPLVDADPRRGLRLGLSNVKGIDKAIDRILDARAKQAFLSLADLAHRARLSTAEIEALATAGALQSLGVSRREGIWAAQSLSDHGKRVGQWFQPTLLGTEMGARAPKLPQMSPVEENIADIATTGISPFAHPVEFARAALDERGILPISAVLEAPVGERIRVAGMITHRQRPHTAAGITFLSLEDETGMLNIVCSAGLWDRYRHILRHSSAVVIRGMVERGDGATNFVADGAEALNLHVTGRSRDFQ